MKDLYPVKKEDIETAEKEMNLEFPSELRNFYINNGYGFFKKDDMDFNRLMDPLSVADFRLKKNDYEYSEYPDEYSEFGDDKLIFFEVSEGYYYSIEINDDSKQKIYDGDQVIANSLEEFLKTLSA